MHLNKKQSVVFTVVFFAVTILGRFYIEPYLAGRYWISIGIGLYFVLVFWLLVKKKFLNFRDESEAGETKNPA